MTSPRRIALLLISIGAVHMSKGQDLLGASVTRTSLGNYWMNFRLDLYVNAATEVERPTIMYENGFSLDTLFLWTSTMLDDNVKLNTYVNNFWYVGPGIFQPHFNISNRIVGVMNVLNSDISPIDLHSEFIQMAEGWSGPDFTAPQNTVVQTEIGAQLIPDVFDPDGDSLQFSLVPCYGDGYYVPTGTTIDPNTGVITTNPPEPGKYAFCTKIEKIRQGVVLSTSYTDMTIQVDQVVGIEEPHATNDAVLFPEAIPLGGSPMVRCTKPNELLVHDVLGRIEHRMRVVPGSTLDCSHWGIGTYLYTLTDLEDGTRKSGKLLIY